jgi:RimJ/RimL family protein N-acetyltransferase
LELLTYLEEKFNLRRIQFTVRVDYNIGLRWAWALGFQQEGILRGYGPDGTDYAIFGRVRKCQESK